MADVQEPTYFRKLGSADGSYKRTLWDATFGLQAVDCPEPSDYVRGLAEGNSRGHISLGQIGKSLDAVLRARACYFGRSAMRRRGR